MKTKKKKKITSELQSKSNSRVYLGGGGGRVEETAISNVGK